MDAREAEHKQKRDDAWDIVTTFRDNIRKEATHIRLVFREFTIHFDIDWKICEATHNDNSVNINNVGFFASMLDESFEWEYDDDVNKLTSTTFPEELFVSAKGFFMRCMILDALYVKRVYTRKILDSWEKRTTFVNTLNTFRMPPSMMTSADVVIVWYSTYAEAVEYETLGGLHVPEREGTPS